VEGRSMKPDDKHWALSYEDPRSPDKILISLPTDMHRDFLLYSRYRGCSISELFRRAITAEIAAEIRAEPRIQASFKGKLRD
jgi:hypothetical protein